MREVMADGLFVPIKMISWAWQDSNTVTRNSNYITTLRLYSFPNDQLAIFSKSLLSNQPDYCWIMIGEVKSNQMKQDAGL